MYERHLTKRTLKELYPKLSIVNYALSIISRGLKK
jgi:hypothetical protein